MDAERITFKVPLEINNKFRAYARSQKRTQNSILKQWIKRPADTPWVPFPFARAIDLDKYANQMWVSKTIRVKRSVYYAFLVYCKEQKADMRDILLSWMLRILEKDKITQAGIG